MEKASSLSLSVKAQRGDRKIFIIIAQIAAAALLICALFLTARHIADEEISPTYVLLPSLAAAVLFVLQAYSKSMTVKCCVPILAAAAIVAATFKYKADIVESALIMVYRIGDLIERYFANNLFDIPSYIITKQNIIPFFAFIFVIFGALSGIIIANRRGLILSLGLSGVCFWALTNIAKDQYYLPLLLSLFGIIIVWWNSSKKFLKKYDADISVKGLAALLAAVALICLSINIFIPKERYDNEVGKNPLTVLTRKFTENPRQLADTADKAFDVPDVPSADGSFDSLRLDLSRENTALRVRCDYNSYLLVRGFSGGEYTRLGWRNFNSEVYSPQKDLFKKMYEKGIAPQDIFSQSIIKVMRKSGEPTELHESKFTAENVGASLKSSFIPYFYVPKLTVDRKNDNMYQTRDSVTANGYFPTDKDVEAFEQPYSFWNLNPNAAYAAAALAKETYTQTELALIDEYSNFVYENYLGVPPEISAGLLEDIKTVGGISGFGRLMSGLKYTVTPGDTPLDKDFVDYFLHENKQGYCVHFASAAVMLFRSMGYPARYVEGYAMPMGLGEQKDEDGYFNVAQKYAHAWAEVYVRYLGWVPVDLTPSSSIATGGDGEIGGLESLSGENSDEASSTETSSESEALSSETPSESETLSSETSSESEASSSETSSESEASSEIIPQDGEEAKNKIKRESGAGAKALIVAALTIIAASVSVYGAYRYRKRRRVNRFERAEIRTAISEIYNYAVNLYSAAEKPINADEAEEEYAARLGDERFIALTALAVAARFSNAEIPERLRRENTEYVKSLADELCKTASFGQKLKIMFI